MAEVDQAELGLDLSKKKKKKVTKKDESENPEEEINEIAQEAAKLFDMSKKKKKKKKTATDENEEEEASDNIDELLENLKVSKQPKKQQQQQEEKPATGGSYWATTTSTTEETTANKQQQAAGRIEKLKASGDFGPESWLKSDRDYYYEELLERLCTFLEQKKKKVSFEPGVTSPTSTVQTSGRRIVLKPPQVVKDGPKKTIFVNFSEICASLNRQPEHMIAFILSELGTEGSVDGTQRLVIRGSFLPKNIESLLRKYTNDYVVCKICGSMDTVLARDASTRLYSVNCNSCGASRTVQAIRTGFLANVGAARRRRPQ